MDAAPPLAAEKREAIRDYFREDRSRMTMMASRKFEVSEQAVVETLVGEWPIVKLRDGAFAELIEALPSLGLMRVFVRSKGAVIESVGHFGGLSVTGPFTNVQTDTLDMHIFHDEIGSIFSVEKWGHDTNHPTYSFQFFDRTGDAAFKAFLWDNFPDVPRATVENFNALARQFAAE
ncbi:ChuX/HutX family heme-like substrate-binding protein [Singulisphaera sp. PoT]|uniref:ChuX/HutX family heme-like substrate-binding protein n=1 Tax=Singulisphaera sp. PoT TaxID=3411797 RepID=UPI003BF529C4